jgi:hypothetical protein
MTPAHPARPRRLKLTAGAAARSVGPAVVGDGPADYACGQCFAVVLRGVDLEKLAGYAVRCASCGCLNDAEVAP